MLLIPGQVLGFGMVWETRSAAYDHDAGLVSGFGEQGVRLMLKML